MSSLFQNQQNPQAAPPPAQAPASDPFSRVGTAEVTQGGVYPVPGTYPVLYVDALKMIRTRKGEDMAIAEIDFADITRRKSLLDTVGHYARPDIVRLRLDRRPRHVVEEMALGLEDQLNEDRPDGDATPVDD